MDGGGYTGWRDTCTVVGTPDGGIHVQWWVHWMEGYMYSGGYTGWIDTCTVVGTLDGGIHVQWWVHWISSLK